MNTYTYMIMFQYYTLNELLCTICTTRSTGTTKQNNMYGAISIFQFSIPCTYMYSMTLYLEVPALWSAELLQVEVEH